MNSKHLATGNPIFELSVKSFSNLWIFWVSEQMRMTMICVGAEFPPLQDGKLRIYSMRHCPFAQRVLLVAEAKGIP